MDAQNQDRSRARRRGALAVLLAIALLALLALLRGWQAGRGAARGAEGAGGPAGDSTVAAVAVSDTAGSTVAPDSSGRDTLAARRGDSVRAAGSRPGRRSHKAADTTARGVDSAADSLRPQQAARDSSAMDTADMMQGLTGSAERDTTPPWVYADPSGGLHRVPPAVRLVADEPCTVEWRFGGEQAWRRYDGAAIAVERDLALQYRAVDTAGNRLEEQTERYEVRPYTGSSRCAAGMELIEIGATVFCIDRYEWPNRRGRRPSAFVSLFQAMDSCLAAGKRLCSTDEWKLACGGPYGWGYPYGQDFERRACVTHDTASAPAGGSPACRGYFEVFDMSGNLAEWTSTRAAADSRFYNVMGGFYESGPQSGCFQARHSYFPQNRHNPVGFRCCADAKSR